MQLFGLRNDRTAQSRCGSKSRRCCNKPSSVHYHNDRSIDLINNSGTAPHERPSATSFAHSMIDFWERRAVLKELGFVFMELHSIPLRGRRRISKWWRSVISHEDDF